MSGLDSQKLGAVFQSRPDLLDGIKRAAGMSFLSCSAATQSLARHVELTDTRPDTPERVTLFNEIASFVYEQISGPEPSAKRRRIDVPANGVSAPNSTTLPLIPSKAAASGSAAEEEVDLVIGEISVSVPQRKKYDICLTAGHLYARAPGTNTPVPGIAYAWKEIGANAIESFFVSLAVLTCPPRACVLRPSARKGTGPA